VAVSWGPERHRRDRSRWPKWLQLAALLLLVVVPGQIAVVLIMLLLVAKVGLAVVGWRMRSSGADGCWPVKRANRGSDLLTAVLAQAARRGAYIGVDSIGRWRHAPAEQALLVLGRPRSGKTSGVIVPLLLTHNGSVVSTSTKPDVHGATGGVRGRLGRVWCSTRPAPGISQTRSDCGGRRWPALAPGTGRY
jgi:type IV secretory pathway TraG/TraD family ATPase VirD4